MLPSRSSLAAVAGAVAASALLATPASADPADPGPVADRTTLPAVSGLPEGAPEAIRRSEPRLRAPQGWPFEQQLSRTSGTGRLAGGASYWSDFVYDDHGAAIPSGMSLDNPSMLAPTQGVYTYPAGPARGNGADVFVAATGVDERASYWRVDWNTLVDPTVPLAVWTFDTDDRATSGVDTWPADAGLTSAGMERALVVSSRGARLLDLRRGTSVALPTTVDRAARSFVVRVPRTVLPVSGSWRVRLATGLASADGRSLASPSISGLPVPPGLPRVYNVAFRTARQEAPVVRDGQTVALVAAFQALAAGVPPFSTVGADGLARFVTGNFWMEDRQADALATGDVSAFSRVVDWGALRCRTTTGEPLLRGYSNRWYVSALGLGQGVVANGGNPAGDGRPNYVGRIQPYSVYVPRSYSPRKPTPLTWTLHSLGVNHNQYGALDPRLLQQLCERRGSICAGTLGYGPDGWYFDEAENDYWSVWRSIGSAYRLDPTRTVISGYSMGGWATYKLGLAHPDLYAAAVTLAGPPRCGVSLNGSTLTQPAFGGRCTTDGVSQPLLGNARWLPYRIGQGQADQLVPFTSVESQVAALGSRGLRYRFVRHPGEDHLAYATQDRFDPVVAGLGRPLVVRNPRGIDYSWRPHLTRRDLGIGTTTAYWLRDLVARSSAPGTTARVQASSRGIAARGHRVVITGPTPLGMPLPGARTDQTWMPTRALKVEQVLALRLVGVRSLTVDTQRARLRCGAVVRVLRSDGPTRLTFLGLRGGRQTMAVRAGSSVQRFKLRCPVTGAV